MLPRNFGTSFEAVTRAKALNRKAEAFRGFKNPLHRTKVRGFYPTCSAGTQAWEAEEKFATGQERQGLKPDIFAVVYGPTKVVP
jgi:hypothetical protein